MVAKRRERLQIEAVLDEIVVFNPDTSEATALNQTATIVFNLCDGEHDVTAMRKALDQADLGPADDNTVWLALRDLSDAGLVDLSVQPPADSTRRDMLRKLVGGAAGAAVLLPVVETITAPPAHAQGSRNPRPGPRPKPITIKPTSAKPTTYSPTTAKPTTYSPTIANPTTANPSTVNPTTVNPTTVNPTTVNPTTVNPTTAKPTTPNPTTIKTTFK
jgi:hypothetical protein